MTDQEQKSELAGALAKSEQWWQKVEATAGKLIKHVSRSPRFIVIAHRLLTDNAKLQQCSAFSFASALFQAAALDLEPGAFSGECFIIPYDGVATFQMGYLGYIKLASRQGIKIRCGMIHQNDKYIITEGTHPRLEVTPAYERPDRGPAILAYAVADFPDGSPPQFVIHNKQEANRRRMRSAGVKAGKQTPWDTDYDAMWMKGAVRQLGKFTAVSDLLRNVARADEYVDSGVPFKPGDEPDYVTVAQAAASEVTGEAPSESKQKESAKPHHHEPVSADPPKNWNPKPPAKNAIITRITLHAVEMRRRAWWVTDADGNEFSTFDATMCGSLEAYKGRELMIAYTENPGKGNKVYKNIKAFKGLDAPAGKHKPAEEEQPAELFK